MRLGICLYLLILAGCSSKESSQGSQMIKTGEVKLRYANGFSINYVDGGKLVEVGHPFTGAKTKLRYLLVERGENIPAHDEGIQVIQIPINTIVCTSTTHIPLLDYLDSSNKLIGFPTPDYISSAKVRLRIDSGFVTDLGTEEAMDLERLSILKPDVMMGYSLTGKLGQFKKIEELGIPVIINGEYLETHPLGRAEWIKFMAAFLNKEEEAEEVFSIIETNYNASKELVTSETYQPTVMSGVVYNDAWFLPGGQNYASKIFRDAGYKYIWENDSSTSFLRLSFESVYEKAKDADYWIGVASYLSLNEMLAADERYGLFKAFAEGKVYSYDVRKGAKGGSEYFELGYLRPDIILKDLIKIAHPEVLPDHELYFHQLLK